MFHNLIDNSLKYGQKLTNIKVCNCTYKGVNKIVYEDDGCRNDPETKKHLFDKGIGRGTGYGLYLIKRTCEIYGWKVHETGQAGRGTRFEFTTSARQQLKNTEV